MRLGQATRAKLLDLAYKGEVLFSRLQGISWDSPRYNGEYALVRTLKAHIRNAVDAGGNSGDWTAEVLRLTQDRCRVACLEPDPDNAAFIASRFANNAHVRLYEAAICDQVGTARFVRGEGSKSGVGRLGAANGSPTIEVPTVTLASVADDFFNEDIDLVKADIEGAEMAMLRGAESLFRTRRIGSMQVEYNSTWLNSKRTLAELFEFCGDHDYTLLAATPLGFSLYPRYGVGLEDFRMRNFILTRKDHLAILKPIGPSGRARVEASL
jgi:FkbM family methyltransferase